MSCERKRVLKWIIFGLEALIGVSALGVGIWMMFSPDLTDEFQVMHLNQDLLMVASALMRLSAIILPVVSLAMWILEKITEKDQGKKTLVLKLHIGLASVMVGLSIPMVICSSLLINPAIENQVKEDVQTKYVSECSYDLISRSWNNMQIEWKCCGSTNYTDYYKSNYTATFQEAVPWTCCVMFFDDKKVVNETGCRIEAQSPDHTEALYLHTKGCYRMIHEVLDKNSKAALVMSCLMFVMELVMLVTSVLRWWQENKERPHEKPTEEKSSLNQPNLQSKGDS